MADEFTDLPAVPVVMFSAAFEALSEFIHANGGKPPNRAVVNKVLDHLRDTFSEASDDELRSAGVRGVRYETILMTKQDELIGLGVAKRAGGLLLVHEVCRHVFARMPLRAGDTNAVLEHRFVETLRELAPRVLASRGVTNLVDTASMVSSHASGEGEDQQSAIDAVATAVVEGLDPVIEKALKPLEGGACPEHGIPAIVGSLVGLGSALGDVLSIGGLHSLPPSQMLQTLREAIVASMEEHKEAHNEHCTDDECNRLMDRAKESFEAVFASMVRSEDERLN